MTNKHCYNSLIKYYRHRYPADVVETIAQILQQREHLPLVPPLAFKVSLVTPGHQRAVNEMINTLGNCKFIVRMFPSVEHPRIYYILVELKRSDLELYAHRLKYEIKLLDKDLKFKYNRNQKEVYEPFRSKDVIEIYLKIINKAMSLSELSSKGALMRWICLHNMHEQNDFQLKWHQASVFDVLKQNFVDHKAQKYDALTSTKNYLGERWGF